MNNIAAVVVRVSEEYIKFSQLLCRINSNNNSSAVIFGEMQYRRNQSLGKF